MELQKVTIPAQNSTPKLWYRFYIAKEEGSKQEFAHKGFHYQTRATSLKELWERADKMLEEYNRREKGFCYLIPKIKRQLKASALTSAGDHHIIGYTSDYRKIFVQRIWG